MPPQCPTTKSTLTGKDMPPLVRPALVQTSRAAEHSPQFVEVFFAGSGIDNEGGILTNTVSACSNTATGEVFDLKATDTFQDGSTINIESDPFLQVVDPANCAVTNSHAIGFRVAGGTGKYAGATGHGRYHIAGNHTPCNGATVPNAVWFEGIFQRP